MRSLLKKKSDAPAGPVVPAWHPNFRDYEKLPDVKVVRTAFFVNGAAILVFVSLAIYFGFREWQLHVVRGQIAQSEQIMARDKRPSDQDVALFGRFKAQEVKINEVDAFVNARPKLSPLLLRLGETLPENVALDAIDVHPTGVSLRMTVRGSAEAAAGYATAYFEQLRGDKQLPAIDTAKAEFKSQARNTSTGRLNVEFYLPFRTQYTEKRP